MKQYCVWIACAGVNRGGDGAYLSTDGYQYCIAKPMTLAQAEYLRKVYGPQCEIMEF